MKRAESKIDPVLSAFRDQVLFLKHNLNARAIASLIHEMESSIKEADTFIGTMEKGSKRLLERWPHALMVLG